MKGQTRGQDIYDSFKNFIDKTGFPIYKLVSITTDGVPAMVLNRIVNSNRSRSLQRRQFRALLEETESDYGDLLLHTDMRRLSRCAF